MVPVQANGKASRSFSHNMLTDTTSRMSMISTAAPAQPVLRSPDEGEATSADTDEADFPKKGPQKPQKWNVQESGLGSELTHRSGQSLPCLCEVISAAPLQNQNQEGRQTFIGP